MKRLIYLAVALATASRLGAQANIYGNNAGFGTDIIERFDKTTGAVLQTYSGISGNGRGVVVVGNTLYYTVTDDPHIYMLNATTGAPIGSILTTVQSMSTIAWDGSTFWTSDYSGTNRAFEIDLTGNVIKTITLGSASDHMDGMEWFQNKLVANRCDACGIYDIYDTDGNLLQANFINTGNASGTGIAFDGTNFYVSTNFSSLGVYDLSGKFVRLTPLVGSHVIEDLSVDYAQRGDIPGNTVPEPGTTVLLGTGLAGMIALRRRLRGKVAA